MKKVFPLLILLGVSNYTFAANTITFEGEVTDQSCSIKVDGSDNPTITLDNVPATSLANANAVAGTKAFEVAITGCAAPKVGIKLQPILANTDGSILKNIAPITPAGNVGLQLLDEGGNPINLAASNVSIVKNTTVPLSPSTLTTIGMSVQYISKLGAATAGKVQSSIEYVITYE